MKIKAVNKSSGEVVELDVNTPKQIVTAWRVAQEYIKTAESLKDQLKKIVPSIVSENGTSDVIGKFMFRISSIQRTTYDKSIMRQVFDEDTLDVFLVPDKPTIDRYIKENLEILGDNSTLLRNNMVNVGNPYQVIKLEKLSREGD